MEGLNPSVRESMDSSQNTSTTRGSGSRNSDSDSGSDSDISNNDDYAGAILETPKFKKEIRRDRHKELLEIQRAAALARANERAGTILINISVLGIALSQLLAKFIYTRNNIGSLEFFATREMINLSMWLVAINIKLKHYMYDTITKP